MLAEFQFALPHGERLLDTYQILRLMPVSIRAPAWGATYYDAIDYGADEVSIRAPAWGATKFWLSAIPSWLFQFALPHGERRLNGFY